MTLILLPIAFALLSIAAYKFGVDTREAGQWSVDRRTFAPRTERRV